MQIPPPLQQPPSPPPAFASAPPRMPGTVKTVVVINVVLIVGTALLMLWAGALTIDAALGRFPDDLARSASPVVLASHLPLWGMLVVAPFLLAKGRGRLLIMAATGVTLAVPVDPAHIFSPAMWLVHKAACLALIVIVGSLLNSRSAATWFPPKAARSVPTPRDTCPGGVIVAFISLTLAAIGHIGQILVERYVFTSDITIGLDLLRYYPLYSGVITLLVAPFLLAGREWPRLIAVGLAGTIVSAFVVSVMFISTDLTFIEEELLLGLAIRELIALGSAILAFIALLLLSRGDAEHWFARRRAARTGQSDRAGHVAPGTPQSQPWDQARR